MHHISGSLALQCAEGEEGEEGEEEEEADSVDNNALPPFCICQAVCYDGKFATSQLPL